jgi:hypothetical protein
MSLLTLIQDTWDVIGVGGTTPTAVATSTDNNVLQLLKLANIEGRVLNNRFRFEKTVEEVVFTVSATANHGTIASITSVSGASVTGMTSGFNYILNDTIWDRTLQRPVFGPLSASHRAGLKASAVTGPYAEYFIRGGILHTIPATTTANYAFEYKSKFWCENATGQGQPRWMADSDVGRLDEFVMHLGLIWRWKKSKGFDYAEDMETYEREVVNYMARDGGKLTLNMAGDPEYRPFINVPDGSWNL